MNLRNICLEVEKAARESGAFILKESEVFDIGKAEKKRTE